MEGIFYQVQKRMAEVVTEADSTKSRADCRMKASDLTKKMEAVVEKYRLVLATGKAERSYSLTAAMVLERAGGLFPWSCLRAAANGVLDPAGSPHVLVQVNMVN
jgi:hypothetical protein